MAAAFSSSEHETEHGRVVLVVGPSGAGKDAIIQAAREHFGEDSRFSFPARLVTRAPSAAENHDSLSRSCFETRLARGAFALHWEAHGLLYGIPQSIDDDVSRGKTVVFNASRSVIGAARARYRRVGVVLVDAPVAVRAARLAARGREHDGEITARVERAVAGFSSADADLVIDNSGTVLDAFHALHEWLHATHGG